MSSDPPQGLAPEPLTTDSQQLLSLALDAQLAGYERVAQDLSLLAGKLNEVTSRGRLGAIARIILTRAQIPGQGFETLLDRIDVSQLSDDTLPKGSACRNSGLAPKLS